ncbi:hypothetical protein [uncultured Legionella sp.]|uniref:hypothetical protein n=1 Tax=uncultured Legionella sp. TaxID=210934 RepID=UPI00260B5222|nr:hypothetical protein [uncultured Legionella sp.]
MSSKEDKIRQKLIEERQKQEALGREMETARLEEERRMATALLEDDASPKPVEEVSFQPTGVEPDDWKKIIKDYNQQYPETPVENNVLRFPSQEDAISFFASQAALEPPRKFLARELGPDGKLTGFNVFSCGDGKLYQGTLEEIQEQLKEAELENKDDPAIKEGLQTIAKLLNPAQSYKESLLKTREPDPLSIKPKNTP